MAQHARLPGRTFGQLYHRFFRTNDLAQGSLALTGRTIDLADVTVPLLAVAGLGDGIAPVAACHHLGDLVPNAASLDLETAPGGHLGVLTGRAARGTTWALLDRHLDRMTATLHRMRRILAIRLRLHDAARPRRRRPGSRSR